MNLSFTVGRGNGDRFAFVTRPRDVTGNTRSPPAPHVEDDYDDRTPLSPRSVVDLEAQRTGPHAEMAERSTPTSRFIHRFRPAIPSFFSTASSRLTRPTSSRYSGDGLPPDTVVNGDESPKTPQFRIAVQDLPSTRLYLPNLTRTWTQGSNGPPSRPATSAEGGARSPEIRNTAAGGIAQPSPAVLASRGLRIGSRSRRRGHGNGEVADAPRDRHGRSRRHRREGSDRSNRSGRPNRSGNQSQQQSGEANNDDREERRRQRRRRREAREASQTESSGSGSGARRSNRPPPKKFLFCFPWVKSRRIRSQILRCFVSGLFLALILTVCKCLRTSFVASFCKLTLAPDLSLSITKNINSSEFTVLLILIILFVTIFFCHGLIRLCMLVVRRRNGNAERERLPEMMGPGGYAIPRRPIRVVLARDEEAAGIESEATKTNPPAYGLWRESVVCITEKAPQCQQSYLSSCSESTQTESIGSATRQRSQWRRMTVYPTVAETHRHMAETVRQAGGREQRLVPHRMHRMMA